LVPGLSNFFAIFLSEIAPRGEGQIAEQDTIAHHLPALLSRARDEERTAREIGPSREIGP